MRRIGIVALGMALVLAMGVGVEAATEFDTVVPAPQIVVTPDSFAVTLAEGDSTSGVLTIGNVGGDTLRFVIRSDAFPEALGFPSRENPKILEDSELDLLPTATMRGAGEEPLIPEHSKDEVFSGMESEAMPTSAGTGGIVIVTGTTMFHATRWAGESGVAWDGATLTYNCL
ncbi:MAG: hypothetical protein KAJ81_07205, partial [Candidatus Latescibacteria bacterium]|nr:hypothetical protein [Candidatus Latescibacterota bacterium]